MVAVPNVAEIARPSTMYVVWSCGTVRLSGCATSSYPVRSAFTRYIGSGEYMKNLSDSAAARMLRRIRSAPTNT